MCAVNMEISDYRRALKACGPGCHFSSKAGKKSLNYLAKLVPNHSSPDAMGSCAKTIGCHPPLLVKSM